LRVVLGSLLTLSACTAEQKATPPAGTPTAEVAPAWEQEEEASLTIPRLLDTWLKEVFGE